MVGVGRLGEAGVVPFPRTGASAGALSRGHVRGWDGISPRSERSSPAGCWQELRPGALSKWLRRAGWCVRPKIPAARWGFGLTNAGLPRSEVGAPPRRDTRGDRSLPPSEGRWPLSLAQKSKKQRAARSRPLYPSMVRRLIWAPVPSPSGGLPSAARIRLWLSPPSPAAPSPGAPCRCPGAPFRGRGSASSPSPDRRPRESA